MEKFEQHVSGVSPLQRAVDGTPAKRKRGERKANPNSEVTTNVVCYCGSRFDDLVDFSAHVRGGCPKLIRVSELRKVNGDRLVAECGTLGGVTRHGRNGEPCCDPCRAAANEYKREYRASPAYREWERAYRASPAHREWEREHRHERYADDSAYRERRREYSREHRARKKADREAAKGGQQAV